MTVCWQRAANYHYPISFSDLPCRLGRLCRLQSFYTVSECFSSLLYSSNPDILYIAHRQFLSERFITAKLLQKSEMRKDIVIELSYKGFSWSGYNSWSQYNHSKSQILTPQRYLFVTMPDNATNGYGWRNKTLRNSELPTTHAKNLVTEKECAVPPRFAYRHRTLHQLILKPKN